MADIILNYPHEKYTTYPNISFADLILQKLQQHGDRQFIVEGATGRSLSFSEVHSLSLRFASFLQKKGFMKKDVMGICLSNILEFPVLFLGVVACGGINCMIQPAYTAREINNAIEITKPKYIICTPEKSELFKTASKKWDFIHEIFVIGETEGCTSIRDLLEDVKEDLIFPKIIPEEDVMMYGFTSGTSGLPKAVMITHRNHVIGIIGTQHTNTLGLKISDTVLVALSFIHSYPEYICMACAYNGCRMVFHQQFEIDQFLQAIQDYKVTVIPINPTIAYQMTKHEGIGNCDFTSVRDVFCSGAPLSNKTEDSFVKKTGIQEMRQSFGMTEVASLVMGCPRGINKSGSIGKPIDSTEAKVIDLVSGEVLGPDVDGEICIRTLAIMKGYLNNPKATAETIDDDGWLHTGDVGHYDTDGFFYIVDRLKDIIKYMTIAVSPSELEAVLLSHPDVKDAAVIGILDEEAGELPYAFVVKKPEAHVTKQQLQDFVAGEVAYYKQLRGGVEFLDKIPKVSSGKILRRELRELMFSRQND